jgi:protein phosphatase
MVEDQMIRDITLQNASLEERVEHLVKKANQYGGRDNITVMMIEPFS